MLEKLANHRVARELCQWILVPRHGDVLLIDDAKERLRAQESRVSSVLGQQDPLGRAVDGETLDDVLDPRIDVGNGTLHDEIEQRLPGGLVEQQVLAIFRIDIFLDLTFLDEADRSVVSVCDGKKL